MWLQSKEQIYMHIYKTYKHPAVLRLYLKKKKRFAVIENAIYRYTHLKNEMIVVINICCASCLYSYQISKLLPITQGARVNR